MATASARVKKSKKVKQVKVRETAAVFTFIKNIIKSLQAFFGFYAFLNIIYWLAYIAKIVDKSFIYFLFKPAWELVAKFYTYKNVEGADNVDFTGLICAISLIISAVILKSVCEFVTDLEEAAKLKDLKRKERAERRMIAKENGRLKAKAAKSEAKKATNSEFVFLFDVNIVQQSGFIQDTQLSLEEIAKIKNNFCKSILNNINANQIEQKGYYRKKLFITYKSLTYFDGFILYARETLNSLLQEFGRPTVRIDFFVALSDLKSLESLKIKLDIMDTICKLGLKNDFICTSSLKEVYEMLPKHKFEFISRGVYNLSKNLNVSNNDEIYSLRAKL